MGFTIPAKNAPYDTPGRVVDFHWPGGLRAIMHIKPTITSYPYAFNGPPYYERYVYGSGDHGVHWSEATPVDTHEAFTIAPLDPTVDRVWDHPVYCGNGKIVGRVLSDDTVDHWLRMESNDFGRSWSLKNEAILPISGVTNEYVEGKHVTFVYAGDGEVWTIRPDNDDDADGEMLGGNLYKSTDYGDSTWELVTTIVGWNVRALCYIGKDSLFHRKMFLCVAGRKADGTMDFSTDVGSNCLAVMRSIDNGVTWTVMQMLTAADVRPHFTDAWLSRAFFTYLGDGEVILQADLDGIYYHECESTLFRSTNYGVSWTEIFRFPVTPTPPVNPPNPSLVTHYSGGIWYLGKQKKQYYPQQYHRYLYAIVLTANALGEGVFDEYYSEDGGDTWTFIDPGPWYLPSGEGLPRIWDTTRWPYDYQIWWPAGICYVEDNEAIPGLYD